MEKIQYTEKIILFIDILAFKDIVKTYHPNKIKIFLEFIYKFLENHPLPNYKMSHFSDSLILSFKLPSDENMTYFFSILQLLMVSLLQSYLILLRGGMCKGNIYHTNKFVFGPGVNKAYKIESEKAIFPRIIVDEYIVNCFNNWNNKADPKKGEMKLEPFFELDFDGNYIFNYLNSAEIEKYKETIKNHFIEEIHDIEDDKIKQKLNYVINKLS